jgi:L-threonylcarbamoyladenylate synthase
VSATTAADVAEELGAELDAIVDGGACRVGLESTIIDLSGEEPAVLREGPVTREALAEALGEPVADRTREAPGARPEAPGQHASHYAPRAQLEVVPAEAVAERVAAHEARGSKVEALGAAELRTTTEARAANQYRALREADRAEPAVIVVPTPPPGALAAALRDRLARASAPRG